MRVGNEEFIPPPLEWYASSLNLNLRLALEAAESGVSLKQLTSDKLNRARS